MLGPAANLTVCGDCSAKPTRIIYPKISPPEAPASANKNTFKKMF
jgi:hypothetical protein